MAFKYKISITSSNIAFEQNWKNKNNLTQTIHQKKKNYQKEEEFILQNRNTSIRASWKEERKKKKERNTWAKKC